jgi:pyruvate-formate lyase
MYPFYKSDMDAGVLTEAEAEDLLKQLWLKFNEVNYVLDSNTGRLIGG